jgi:hypothetical protein
MNDQSNHPESPRSLEEGVNILLGNAGNGLRHRYRKCEDKIRKSPAQSVVLAVAVGYLLHLLPVRAILVTQVRVLSALTPPALLLLGAAKLYEFLQKQKKAKQGPSGE